MLRPQEDRRGRDLLQARQRSHQNQRMPHRAGGARNFEVQGIRAHPVARSPEVRRSGHAHPSEGRRSHFPDLRHQTEHCQGSGGVLPEVRGRAVEEGDQGHSVEVRQDVAGG